ncbi:MAG: T9SS type A sorting domain-containing protein [Bacteroidota bacterium]
MKKVYLLLLFTAALSPLVAQVNFSEHIAPIIYKNCTTCHRGGEVGPMPFTNYEEVKNWASMIQYVTEIRYMPPWKPDTEYSSFQGERSLSQQEIDLITEWVSNGSPQGDPSLEPPLPDFPAGSQVGTPDLVLSFSQAYEHQGGNQDNYRVFVLPTGLTEDKALDAIELRPGNSKIVHHALFAYDTSGEGRQLDAQDAEYGYDGFGGFGVDGSFENQFPGYVPGQKARRYPAGLGQMLPANSDLLIQMHYAPIPFPETDSSSVNIFFKKEPVQRYVQNYIMLPFDNILTNGPFVIYPGVKKTFHGVFTIPFDISVISLFPHMHLLGKDWEVYSVSPTGDTTNLISIPDWDFNWQGTYNFKRFIILEAGSKLHAYATYDNTADNPLNPNDPPQFVTWGERTTDEMFYLPISYVPYQAGDEDVVFDDEVTSTDGGTALVFPENKFYPVYPNPTSENITVGFQLAQPNLITINLFDTKGTLLRQIASSQWYGAGTHQLNMNLPDLATGTYYINIRGDRLNMSEAFNVTR